MRRLNSCWRTRGEIEGICIELSSCTRHMQVSPSSSFSEDLVMAAPRNPASNSLPLSSPSGFSWAAETQMVCHITGLFPSPDTFGSFSLPYGSGSKMFNIAHVLTIQLSVTCSLTWWHLARAAVWQALCWTLGTSDVAPATIRDISLEDVSCSH